MAQLWEIWMPLVKLCNSPGCEYYAEPYSQYCLLHKPAQILAASVKRNQRPEMAVYKDKRWPKVREFVIKRDDEICQNCNIWIEEPKNRTVDHINGIQFDDTDFDPDNLRLLCRQCNGGYNPNKHAFHNNGDRP
jgi:5-methylcytosine-specific restriction endonuclease McrA